MQRLLNYPQTPTLPIEIIEAEILHRLPPKSLLRFKCVCKSFRTIISSPEFIALHLRHSLSSHANRLVLLIGNCSELGMIDLDAPKSVPRTPTTPIFPFDDEKSFILGHCHGLLCIGTVSHGFFYYKLINDERWVDDVSLPESEFGLIMEVDFEEDVADFFMQSQPYVVDLGVVDGCLCLLTTYMLNHKSVWIMKEYGVKESWVKVLDASDSYVTRSLRFVPLAYTSRGARSEIVLWDDLKCRLTWYNITHKTSTGIKLRGLGNSYWEHWLFDFNGAYVCKGSLVALDGRKVDG